jgi:hypothetical protein
MKKLFAALLVVLVLWPGDALGQQVVGPPALYCNKSFIVSAGATSITQVVAGVASQSIHICGYVLNAGAAAATFQRCLYRP